MIRSLAISVLALFLSSSAVAQTAAAGTVPPYPAKPVRMIVPFAPGGSADILARALSQRLSEQLGQTVVVENRGGAGGVIGVELAARAPADGYSVLLTTNGPVTVNRSLQKQPTYDALKDFVPLSILAALPDMLVAHPSLPVRSVKDLIALAKAKPGQITYASGGAGASNHLAAELFKYMAAVDLLHVPYKGGGPALIGLLTGETGVLFATLPSAIVPARANRITAIAVTGDTRSAVVPQVPTISESGVSGYESTMRRAIASTVSPSRERPTMRLPRRTST